MADQEFNIPNGSGGDGEGGLYELQKMREIHHEIVRQRIADPTKTQKEIAETLGITAQMVSYTLNSEVVQRKLSVLRGAADEDALRLQAEMRSMAPMLIQKMFNIAMKGSSETDQRLAASDLLDRVPETSKRKTHRTEDGGQVDEEELNEIKQLARESGIIEDAEYEEIKEPNEDLDEDRAERERRPNDADVGGSERGRVGDAADGAGEAVEGQSTE